MKWIKACIQNKLIVYIFAFLICLIGIFSIALIKIAPFPSIQFGGMKISLNYPGANAQTVDRQVTAKIVSGLQSINNVQNIVANSQAGSAEIDLALNNSNQEETLQTEMQVIQAISASNLPSAVSEPQVQLNQGQSDLLTMALISNFTPIFTLQTIAKSMLVPMLSSMPEVKVSMDSFDPVVKVMLNPEAIAAYNLNPADLTQALNEIYQSNPLGEMDVANEEYVLNLSDNLQTLDALNNVIIGYQHTSEASNTELFGAPIYLKNVANISFEPRNVVPDNIFEVNGKQAVFINMLTYSTANPFSVSSNTNKYLNNFEKDLPAGIKILKLFDISSLMHASIMEVINTIIISSILVLLIAFIFLGKLRATLIPVITIPVCLLGAITFVYVLGFTINILTLLALVIAVGLVVDDAVVVVENITRYIEQGMNKFDAVVKGSSDIALTIIGITLTLIFVYLPIFFSSNNVADLFKPFALTLAAAIFISGIIALTLTPVMAVSFLSDEPLNEYQIKFDNALKNLIEKYQIYLEKVLSAKSKSLKIIIVLIVIGGVLALHLPKRVFPDDPNRLITIKMMGTYQDSVNSLKEKLGAFSPFYHDKKLENYMLNISRDPSSGQLQAVLNLIVKSEYLKSSYSIADSINKFIEKENIENTFVKVDNISNWGGDYDLSFYIYGGSDINAVNNAAKNITAFLKKSGHYSYVANMINQPQKQLVFDINMPKAASLGIYRQTITQLLSTYYGGFTLNNYFNIQGLSVPIVVQAENEDLMDPNSLQKILIQSPITKQYYPITDFVSLSIAAKPLVVTTFDGQPAVQITANLNKNYSIGKAISEVNQLMISHYPLMQYQYTDAAQDYLRSNNQTLLIVIMSLFSVYFLLAILFRNLLDPFIIMLTVPFSVVGGALSLYLISGSINLYSSLGLITLVGLITKHGIMIVQFANDEMKKGLSVKQAIITATALRFRPIVMTTLVMIFGSMPLMFSSNVFYMARENLGITLIGGLLIGTLFSLFIVPLVYVLVKTKRQK